MNRDELVAVIDAAQAAADRAGRVLEVDVTQPDGRTLVQLLLVDDDGHRHPVRDADDVERLAGEWSA